MSDLVLFGWKPTEIHRFNTKIYQFIYKIYNIYTIYIHIYTRYVQNTRRRPGRPGALGPGRAAAAWPPPGILYISCISCIYLVYLVYKLIYFVIKSIYFLRFPFEQVQVGHRCIFEFFPPFPHWQINRTLPQVLQHFYQKIRNFI